MLASWTIIGIYASFITDLVIWPIPSEASAASLHKNAKITTGRKVLLLLALLMSLTVYLAPLVLAILAILGHSTRVADPVQTSIGLTISLLGRSISLLGTHGLRSTSTGHLATRSVYRYSRNPITTGMHLSLIGLIMCFNLPILWAGIIFYFLYMNYKINLEEVRLAEVFGHQYSSYQKKTPKYLLI